MAERTVLASFQSVEDARQAERQIQSLGVSTTQVDELHAIPGARPHRNAFIISGKIPSLASITLDNDVQSRDAAALLAADPTASGMSDGQGNITGRNVLLTVVCPDHLTDKVVQVIRACNGFT